MAYGIFYHMWSKLHPRFFAWGLIVLTAAALFVRYPAGPQNRTVPGDFAVYLRAVERMRAGETPYHATDPVPYKYSPGVLAPLSALPHDPARAWFWYGTVSILLLAIALLVGAPYSSWRSVALLGVGLVACWKGMIETFDAGQLEVLVLSLAVISAALLNRASFLSGVVAGFLPGIKMPWVLLLLPFMTAATLRAERRGRLFFSGYLLSCVAWGAAIPSLLYGPDQAKLLSQDWIGLLKNQSSSLFLSDINQSLWVSSQRWLGLDWKVSVGIAAVAASLLLGLLMTQAVGASSFRKQPPIAWVSPWLIFVQLVSPQAWRWGSVLLIGMPLAVGALVPLQEPKEPQSEASRLAERNLRFSVGAITILLWMLQQNPVAASLGFRHWTDFHGVGLITAYWLSLLLLVLI